MWEYFSTLITKSHINDKLVWEKTIDGTQFIGMNNILNYYGSHGYELVSFVIERWYDWGESGAVDDYRATFKRLKK